MKKFVVSLLSSACLFADVSLITGWNLVGGVSSSDLNVSQYKIVWTYQDNMWKNSIQNTLSIKKSDGIWILNLNANNKKIVSSKSDFESLELHSGWNLVGGIDNRLSIYGESIGGIFAYSDNSWILNPKENTLDTTKGYWIYAYSPHILNLQTPPEVNFEVSNQNNSGFNFSDSDYSALSTIERIQVLDKLFSTLFLGLKKSDIDKYKDDNNSITKIKALLNTSDIKSLAQTEEIINGFQFGGNVVMVQKALARLFYMPISKEYLNFWVAYNLINSKFFSASSELNTVEDTTGVNLFQKIFTDVNLNKSTQEILYSYLISEEHWRRFRSPEDNTREVLELQLKVFDDSLVPLSATACQNYRYNENEKNLVIDFNYNYEVINIFNQNLISCEDFYTMVSKDVRVKEVFIDYFLDFYFPTYTQAKKTEMKTTILGGEARTYQDILLQIIFSDEYLKNSIKPKTIEELFLSNAKKIDFIPALNTFSRLSDTAKAANQPIMYYKLGRELTPPTDILSASVIMKNFRNIIMTDVKDGMFNDWDAGWSFDFVQTLNWSSKETFLDNIFLYMVQRGITKDEKDTFLAMFKEYNILKNNDKSIMVKIVLDYISQIPETYVMKSL